MKNQRLKKLQKKGIVPVTPSLLFDTTLLTLASAMYDNPKFLCNESVYLNTIPNLDTDVSLPENLIINGDLNLNTAHITKLPKNLVVKGVLCINGTKINRLEHLSAIKIMFNCPVTIDIKTVQFNKCIVYNKYNVLNFKEFNQTIKNKFVFL